MQPFEQMQLLCAVCYPSIRYSFVATFFVAWAAVSPWLPCGACQPLGSAHMLNTLLNLASLAESIAVTVQQGDSH
jgi:hypothetical protein